MYNCSHSTPPRPPEAADAVMTSSMLDVAQELSIIPVPTALQAGETFNRTSRTRRQNVTSGTGIKVSVRCSTIKTPQLVTCTLCWCSLGSVLSVVAEIFLHFLTNAGAFQHHGSKLVFHFLAKLDESAEVRPQLASMLAYTSRSSGFSLMMGHPLHSRGCHTYGHAEPLAQNPGGEIHGGHVPQNTRDETPPFVRMRYTK